MLSDRKLRSLLLAVLLGTLGLAIAAEAQVDVSVVTDEGRRTLPVSTIDKHAMVPLEALLTLVSSGAEIRPGAENGAVISAGGSMTRLTDGNSFVSVAGQLVLLSSPVQRVSGQWFVPLDFMGKVLPTLSPAPVTYRETDRTLLVGDQFPKLYVRTQRDPAYTRIEVTTSREVPIEVARRGQEVLLSIQAPFLQTDFRSEELLDGVVDRVALAREGEHYELKVELGERFFEMKASPAEPPDHGLVLNLLRSRVPKRTGVIGTGEPETIQENLQSIEEREAAAAGGEAPAEAEPPPEGSEEAGTEVETVDGLETINLPPDFGTPGDPLQDADRGPARLRIVTIDPGHGGTEAGAEGADGLLEKDLALVISRKLRRLLQERMGLRVILTRDGDRDLDLDERASIANNNKADLFISVHADASPRHEARGSSVYFLSYASAEQTHSVTMAQSRSSSRDDGLDFILWDMAQASHLNQSSTLAEILQEELIRATGTEKINRGIKQNTFRVLKGATMPAVLVEVGFISNPQEESLLRTEAYQEKLAEALYRGVLRFKDLYENQPRAERASRGRE